MKTFSRKTLAFIETASRQKSETWLDRHRDEYEEYIKLPLQEFAREMKTRLARVATGYHFPQRGIGRMRRSKLTAQEYGGPYRNYLSYSASRPAASRFDRNPNLFFLIYPFDEDGEKVLCAGGFYMPSSRQVRAIRESIAEDASAFERLFASKAFASRFPGGFSDERKSSRVPRGFDPGHPRMDWIRLQAFFVWRPYTINEFTSPDFYKTVAEDWAQIVRLNELLELAVQGRLAKAAAPKEEKATALSRRLEEIEAPRRKMDF